MRIATKYCMEEVQPAIVMAIQSKSLGLGISQAIAILGFIAEFPEHFEEDYVQPVFLRACSTHCYPSTEDLGHLMAHPDLIVAMMKYREGRLNPDGAVWNPEPDPLIFVTLNSPPKVVTPMDAWLSGELKSLGLKKR